MNKKTVKLRMSFDIYLEVEEDYTGKGLIHDLDDGYIPMAKCANNFLDFYSKVGDGRITQDDASGAHCICGNVTFSDYEEIKDKPTFAYVYLKDYTET